MHQVLRGVLLAEPVSPLLKRQVSLSVGLDLTLRFLDDWLGLNDGFQEALVLFIDFQSLLPIVLFAEPFGSVTILTNRRLGQRRLPLVDRLESLVDLLVFLVDLDAL